jgi:uncharacterized protein YecT (DUF1311 family)
MLSGELAKDVVLLLLGGLGSAAWYYWRRRTENAPTIENIDKAHRLLSLRKDLDNTTYTLQDLKALEDALMGRAEVARNLSIGYEDGARQIRVLEDTEDLSQAEMNIRAARASQRADDRLSAVIAELKKYYSPEEISAFDATNHTWRDYQIKNAQFAASRYEGGSIQPLIYASALESVAIARLVELERELESAKATQVPFEERDAF